MDYAYSVKVVYPINLFMVCKKNIIYALIVHCWIVNHWIVYWTSATLISVFIINSFIKFWWSTVLCIYTADHYFSFLLLDVRILALLITLLTQLDFFRRNSDRFACISCILTSPARKQLSYFWLEKNKESPSNILNRIFWLSWRMFTPFYPYL